MSAEVRLTHFHSANRGVEPAQGRQILQCDLKEARSRLRAPGDGVAQQCNERLAFPRAMEGERRVVCRVSWPGCADRGVVAMAERDVRDTAPADRPCIAEHAGPAVGLQ